MWAYGWGFLRGQWKKIGGDRSGLALIYVTLTLPVIVGVALLSIDLGRIGSLQSSLQHGGDALALAGAGELDRRPDAIVRANRAIANLITTNESLFATSVVTIDESAVSVRYLSAIPGHGAAGSDIDPITAAFETADPALARFVEVVVTPQNFNTIFPATFVGAASNTALVGATAVAGFDAAVCQFTPLFICNPFEPDSGVTDELTDYGLYAHVSSTATKRRQFRFKAFDQACQWSPGNYGFLEANAGPGAKALGESIASTVPDGCYLQNGLTTKPGNTTVTKNAFNVRFDLYAGSYSPNDYPPSVNVRKGYIVWKKNGAPNACNNNVPVPSDEAMTPAYPALDGVMGLPRDSSFVPDGACGPYDRMGNGDWGGDTLNDPNVPDFEQYWATNFGGTHPTYSNINLPTRYDIYRYEIDNGLVGTQSTGVQIPGGGTLYRERGDPVCNAGAGIDNPDRRIIYGAIINCRATGLSDQGGSSGGPYQAVAFGKFFMTEPMGDPPDSVLWTELIDIVQPGDANSVARDMVQLYR
jgi:Flp pilus assembly protein TadG